MHYCSGPPMHIAPALTLIRRTIENNAATVDLVARGEVPRAFLTWRFGYVTGREASRIPLGAPIRFRPTDMVGVEIRHRKVAAGVSHYFGLS